jgi:ring-1,2-phenylacetyl-CoA epoxidase subunit PaaE
MLALAQLRRDVAHVRNRLRGRRTTPIVLERRMDHDGRTAANDLRIARVQEETHDIVTLVLRDDRGARFDFLPGQFFTVTIDGVARNYSASNVPGGDELHLTIKRKEGGELSPLLCAAEPGTTLHVGGPYGSFTVAVDPAKKRRIVLIAGGVGITPLVSIAKTVLATEAASEVALLYGNRSPADTAFRADLDALARACPDRFVLRHVLETDSRRLDRSVTSRLFATLPPKFATADVYVCGPDGMMTEVLAALASLGVADRRIRTERFVVGPRNPSMVPQPGGARSVAIQVNGREHRALAFGGATVLDAGLTSGISMPFSCIVGGCGACRVRLVEGSVTMEEPNCLTDDEKKAGWVLACVGRPDAGGCVVRVEEEGGAG